MVRFNLLENALDSVETGLDYFNKALEGHERRDYKQCLLNLFQAAELLLKAVVSRNGAGAIFNPVSLQKKCVDPAIQLSQNYTSVNLSTSASFVSC